MQERGVENLPACVSCAYPARPAGPFSTCVTPDNFLLGSCANCHMDGTGNKCSKRPPKVSRSSGPSRRQQTAMKTSPKKRRKLDSFELQVQEYMKLTPPGLGAMFSDAYITIAALHEAGIRMDREEERRSAVMMMVKVIIVGIEICKVE